jgi:hypothetical protein
MEPPELQLKCTPHVRQRLWHSRSLTPSCQVPCARVTPIAARGILNRPFVITQPRPPHCLAEAAPRRPCLICTTIAAAAAPPLRCSQAANRETLERAEREVERKAAAVRHRQEELEQVS